MAAGNFFTLSFTYTFERTDDVVFFAYSVPYSLKMHRQFLGKVLGHPETCKSAARGVERG